MIVRLLMLRAINSLLIVREGDCVLVLLRVALVVEPDTLEVVVVLTLTVVLFVTVALMTD